MPAWFQNPISVSLRRPFGFTLSEESWGKMEFVPVVLWIVITCFVEYATQMTKAIFVEIAWAMFTTSMLQMLIAIQIQRFSMISIDYSGTSAVIDYEKSAPRMILVTNGILVILVGAFGYLGGPTAGIAVGSAAAVLIGMHNYGYFGVNP